MTSDAVEVVEEGEELGVSVGEAYFRVVVTEDFYEVAVDE